MAGREDLFLPTGYTENLPEPVSDGGGAQLDFWARDTEVGVRRQRRYQDPVYRYAARRARRDDVVLDIGCGTGDNLAARVVGRVRRAVGVDQPSAIAIARRDHPDGEWLAGDLRDDALWEQLRRLGPDVAICADVIEHVDDTIGLLARLRHVLGDSSVLILSTPDRERVENQPSLGPPRNTHHIREWTMPEMTRLLRSAHFEVLASKHVLPRHYSLTVLEAKMFVWRAVHRLPVPARRSSMVFELAKV